MKCPTCGIPILEHPANRCLDTWVAEKVMRDNTDRFIWKRYGKPDCIQSEEYGGPQEYSTDIAAAWQVVEKIKNTPYLYPQLRYSHSWVFGIWRNNPNTNKDYGWLAEVYADTAPLAICRAALLAVIG